MMRPSPPTLIEPVRLTCHSEITQLLARRRYEVGFTQLDLDDAAGWADGLCAKAEAGYRSYGVGTLPLALQALGVVLEVRLIPNPDWRIAVPLLERSHMKARQPRKQPRVLCTCERACTSRFSQD